MDKIILNITVKPKLVGLDSSLAILEMRLSFLKSLNVLLTSSSWNFTPTEQTGLRPHTFPIGDVDFLKNRFRLELRFIS